MPALHCTVPKCSTDPFEPVGDYDDTHYAAKTAGWTYSHAYRCVVDGMLHLGGGHGYLCPRHRGYRAWWPELAPRLAIEAVPDVPRPGWVDVSPDTVGVAGPGDTHVAGDGGNAVSRSDAPGHPDVPQPASHEDADEDRPPGPTRAGLGHPDDTAALTVVHGPEWAELADEIARRDRLAGDDG
jgi:hypothetical protein